MMVSGLTLNRLPIQFNSAIWPSPLARAAQHNAAFMGSQRRGRCGSSDSVIGLAERCVPPESSRLPAGKTWPSGTDKRPEKHVERSGQRSNL